VAGPLATARQDQEALVSMIFGNMPGVKSLRILRAFRVMRLFGRLQSLRQIIAALTQSIIPVLNAFLIMMLITRSLLRLASPAPLSA